MERSLVPKLMDTLLDEIAKNYVEFNNTVTDDVLSTLFGVFDKILYNALELIESNSVTLLHFKNTPSSTDEQLIQVTNTRGSSYLLFYRVNYCQCVFYKQKVILSKSYPACKHFIAANLAYVWNKYRRFETDFNNYKQFIDDIERNDGK